MNRVRHGSSATFETKSGYYRVARQSLLTYTAVARLGFKHRATAVLKSNDQISRHGSSTMFETGLGDIRRRYPSLLHVIAILPLLSYRDACCREGVTRHGGFVTNEVRISLCKPTCCHFSVGCLWHSHGKNPVRLYPKLQSQPIGLPKIFIDYLFFQADQSDCTKSVSIFNRFASSEESRNQNVPCQICRP